MRAVCVKGSTVAELTVHWPRTLSGKRGVWVGHCEIDAAVDMHAGEQSKGRPRSTARPYIHTYPERRAQATRATEAMTAVKRMVLGTRGVGLSVSYGGVGGLGQVGQSVSQSGRPSGPSGSIDP